MREVPSSHWYRPDGTPAYTVIGANGTERPTTLRDARKLGLVPSVTGIIRCAAAPALEYWKQEQMMLASLTLPRDELEDEATFIRRVWADSREHAKQASIRGTEIHSAVEQYLKQDLMNEQYEQHITGAVEVLREQTSYDELLEERSFCHPHGYGGKVDLYSPPDSMVIDIKTKEFTQANVDDLKTWDDHHMQLAAYREGLQMPHAKCAILYISVNEPGLARLLWVDAKDLLRGWSMFQSLLKFWQAKNRYWPTRGYT